MQAPVEGAPSIPTHLEFAPVATNQRIEALDVVRGFALIGIFLMNIEFFNRTFGSFNEGMLRGLTGLDWLASWLVNYLVQGKFWTIFSLLFGMGFAVMLVNAERKGRANHDFIKIYLRRILALAVFGALHYIFIWEGDILFSYAVAALGLLIVLYGKPKPILIGCVVLLGLGFIPGLGDFFGVLAGLVMTGLFALYLRSDKRFTRFDLSIPLFSFIMMIIGACLSIAAIVFWLLPDGPTGPRLPLSFFGPMLFITGWLSWKYFDPLEKRSVRMAVSVYFFYAFAMTAAGLSQYFGPDPTVAPAGAERVAAKKEEPKAAAEPVAPAAKVDGSASAEKASDKATPKTDAKKEKPKKTKAERAAEAKAERAKNLAENAAEKAKELKIFTHGSYLETVEWRARKLLEKAAGDAGFAIVLIGMFLLGVWFVRSGVMENTRAHLPFFKKLALYGLPIGIGIGLLGSAIAMSHTPGDRTDGWGIARGLLNIGNLPACLGYVGLVVVMLHSNTVFSRIRVLAPLGRMALTNYLMQSIICAIYFYGFALGHWGMPRSQQVLFVLVVCGLQIAFSQWWLARFKYGPMEWLWRGFTYRQVPAFRSTTNAGAVTA